MNLYEAAHLARQLMCEHGLDAIGWTFSFDHARRRFGRCDYTNKRITLSRPLTFLNCIEEVRDTILHEIAHALAPGAGHGARWRAMCRRVGARAVRCYDDQTVVAPPRRAARWEIGCPGCDWWVPRHRRARRKYVCATCRSKVVYRAAAQRAGVETRSDQITPGA
jgi:predicted SprT family Zn-dependent metalloprotease